MDANSQQVYLSQIDKERFGIQVARAPLVTLAILSSVIAFCRANKVSLLIARCLVDQLQTVQAMEREGFSLMDTLVYYVRNLLSTPIPKDAGEIPVRPFLPGEEAKIEAVAADSFRGYFGHYHADSRLDPVKCDEAYVSWALRSCLSREAADEVLVADSSGRIVGFSTLRMNDSEEGEGVLFCVAPSAQGRGIGRSIMIHGMEWCVSKAAKRMIISTQITNVAIQKVWIRLGFEPSHAYYTLHKWFDDR
jgi:GNAT superfamily N-acetyltransferase